MDSLREFLENLMRQGLAKGHFLGFLQVMIGRKIAQADGSAVTSGLSWRDLAAVLKRFRWDPDAIAELGLDPSQLPPKDRQKYWLSAIARACVDSPEPPEGRNLFAAVLRKAGYVVNK